MSILRINKVECMQRINELIRQESILSKLFSLYTYTSFHVIELMKANLRSIINFTLFSKKKKFISIREIERKTMIQISCSKSYVKSVWTMINTVWILRLSFMATKTQRKTNYYLNLLGIIFVFFFCNVEILCDKNCNWCNYENSCV